MAKQHDALAATAERATRARELVGARAYVATAESVYVFSDRPGVPGYEVEPARGCSCPDATVGVASRALAGRCKHWWVWALVNEQRGA
jgi:hypothetical protein